MAEELYDDVGRAKDFGAIGRQFCAFLDVFLVGIARGLAGTGLGFAFWA